MERLRRDIRWWLSYIPRLIGHFRNRRQLGQSVGLPSVAPGNECGSPDLEFSEHPDRRVGESEINPGPSVDGFFRSSPSGPREQMPTNKIRRIRG